MARHIHVHVHDGSFNESDHPRAENGKFGSGGGSAGGSRKGEAGKGAGKPSSTMGAYMAGSHIHLRYSGKADMEKLKEAGIKPNGEAGHITITPEQLKKLGLTAREN